MKRSEGNKQRVEMSVAGLKKQFHKATQVRAESVRYRAADDDDDDTMGLVAMRPSHINHNTVHLSMNSENEVLFQK